MTFSISEKGLFVLRWISRIWAMALVLFWGMFLVEHVFEWVVNAEEFPPAWVLGTLVAHFALLIGLLIGWKWELMGAVISLVAASLFLPGKVASNIAALAMFATLVPASIWFFVSGISAGRELNAKESRV